MKKIFAALAVCCFIFGQTDTLSTIPTDSEIQKVYDYLQSGIRGAILYDSKITSKIIDRNPLDNLTTTGVDSTVYIWINFLLPARHVDESYSIIVQRGPIPEFVNKPTLRIPNDVGLLNYRISRKFVPKRPGKYSVKIYKRDIVVKEHEFTVDVDSETSE